MPEGNNGIYAKMTGQGRRGDHKLERMTERKEYASIAGLRNTGTYLEHKRNVREWHLRPADLHIRGYDQRCA